MTTGGSSPGRSRSVKRRDAMVGPRDSNKLPNSQPKSPPSGATRRTAIGLVLGAPLLGACSGLSSFSNPFSSGSSGPAQQPLVAGTRPGNGGVGLALCSGSDARGPGPSAEEAAPVVLARM